MPNYFMPERNRSECNKKLVNVVGDVSVGNALPVDQEKQLEDMEQGKRANTI